MRLEERVEKLERTTPANNVPMNIVIIACAPGGESSRYRLIDGRLVAIEIGTAESKSGLTELF